MLRALTWNLFHGRDWPREPALRSARARLRQRVPFLDPFATVLAREDWDVALLQEAPPRWLAPLCRRIGAHGALALTARNAGAPLRRRLADRLPQFVGAHEGGSNQVLVRPPWRIARVERRVLTRRPERRRLLWARIEGPGAVAVGVGCVHLTVRDDVAAARELLQAAEHATALSGPYPVLLGGDLNLSPRRCPGAFAELLERFGLDGPTLPDAIDHLLVHRLATLEAPSVLPAARREVPGPTGLALRLSDHAPVVARFGPATIGA